MEVCLVEEAGVEYSPESKSLDRLFGKKGPDYLKKVLDYVSKERHTIFELKKPAGAKWKIGPLEDTIYRGESKAVNQWGDLYLPEIVSMQVVGVVEGTSCQWDHLVLMICEDGKLYAYDGVELHLVASSMKQLREEGIRYPGYKRYYEGEAFKDMTEKDWEKVWKSPTGRALEREHCEQVLEHKAECMKYLKATAAIQESRGKPPGQLVTSLGPNNAHLNQNQKQKLFQAPEKDSMKKVLVNMRYFRSNAEAIIRKMLELNNSCQDKATPLVDEILHSIFFLGRINTPPFSPEMIVNDSELLDALRHCYPQPFELYCSQLPRRSPFSCLLDMIVLLKGQKNENEIKQKLQEIISDLCLDKGAPLVSSTICVSQENPNSERYYGVSMSTSGRDPGRIMVAASCLPGSWDRLVAGAVMSFTPTKRVNKVFQGTFKLPQHVSCKAFSLHGKGALMSPCKSCVKLFGLGGNDENPYPYGNCAEVESLSKMFKKEKGVMKQAQPTSEKFTPENRIKAEKSVETGLWNLLKTFKFPKDHQFYIPPKVEEGGKYWTFLITVMAILIAACFLTYFWYIH